MIGNTRYCEFGVEICVLFDLHGVVRGSWLKSGVSEHDAQHA